MAVFHNLWSGGGALKRDGVLKRDNMVNGTVLVVI